MQYPRSVVPQFFADHIGNLTVELVLASVEISTLLIRVPPTLETLAVLMEAEAFPGNEPEGDYTKQFLLPSRKSFHCKNVWQSKYCNFISSSHCFSDFPNVFFIW